MKDHLKRNLTAILDTLQACLIEAEENELLDSEAAGLARDLLDTIRSAHRNAGPFKKYCMSEAAAEAMAAMINAISVSHEANVGREYGERCEFFGNRPFSSIVMITAVESN